MALTPQQIEAVNKFVSGSPEQQGIAAQSFNNLATPEDIENYANWFSNWWSDSLSNDPRGSQLLADSPTDTELLNALDFEVLAGDTTVPLEQGLLQQALPGLVSDVESDAQRRSIADQLGQNALAGANAANERLARTQGGRFDGATYLRNNPDVAAAYEAARATDPSLNADTYAEQHYLTTGQREGRQPAYIQNPQLAQDFANADRTTAANIGAANQAMQTQIAALGDATNQMQQNLQGELAEKAAALQQQLGTLYQNLDQLDAAQKAALTDQIATMQQDLEQSVATQRQALADQIAALGTAADAQSVAQRSALQQEIAGLTAAQAPLADARMRAAELQATAVNVGLERTKDQLTADAARSGFVGGSTVQDAALARATVDARQRAAEAVGGARVANASDMRDIGVRGSTGERTIADSLALAKRDIAERGATGNAGLTTAGAIGRQQLGDAGATGLATIRNATGTARASIGAQGANTTFSDATIGANQSRSLADQLAQGRYGLTSTNAQDVLGATQAGNAAKATYYDNDYNRSLAASLAIPAIAGNTVATLTSLDNYAKSGLGRTQGLLNWWGTNQAAAPAPGAVAVQPDTSGNSWATLGSGLVNAGMNIGAANRWWQPSQKTSATPGGINAGGSNLYTSPLT